MNNIRQKLESLSFEAMYPMRHAVLNNAVKKARGNRRKIVDIIENTIKNRLEQGGLNCDVAGREKNLYSIYKKMLNKKSPWPTFLMSMRSEFFAMTSIPVTAF